MSAGMTVEEMRNASAYMLADMAGCGTPEGHGSPGAKFLDSVRDEVARAIEDGRITLDDFDDDGQLHSIADDAPSIWTHERWRQFADLAAYFEEPEFDDAWPRDLNEAAAVALYQIAGRLTYALCEAWRAGWTCPVCGAEVDEGCDTDGCGNPAGALVGLVNERLATLAAGEPDDTADGDGPADGPRDTCMHCGTSIAPDAVNGWVHVPDDVAGCGTVDAEGREIYATPAKAPEVPAEPLPVRTRGASLAEAMCADGDALSVLTGPVDLPPVADPILSLIDRAEASDMGIRVARRALVADQAVSRFRRKVWTVAGVLAVVSVLVTMWAGGVW